MLLHRVQTYVPPLFQDFDVQELVGAKNMDTVQLQVKTYVDQLSTVERNGHNLFIYSTENGTGKTGIGYYILSAAKGPRLNAQGSMDIHKIAAVKFGDFLNLNLQKMTDDIKQALTIIDRTPFLLLDDVSPAFTSGEAHRDSKALLLMMAYRREHLLPTIITSNLTPEKFDKFFGATTASKVLENFSYLEVKGGDMRPILYESLFANQEEHS